MESYSKWPWVKPGVCSPMILIVALLADTVPSEPSPKNTARDTSSGSMSSSGSQASDECETSSRMPTVNRRRGASRPSSSNTAATIAGVNSLDDSP